MQRSRRRLHYRQRRSGGVEGARVEAKGEASVGAESEAAMEAVAKALVG